MITFQDIPEVEDIDIAFSCIRNDRKLLLDAKEQGFYSGCTKYNDMFKDLFFKGGKIPTKPSLNEVDKIRALRYFKALSSSFEPKHEEKEAVCALILKLLCEG